MSQEPKLDPNYKGSIAYFADQMSAIVDQNNLILSKLEEVEMAQDPSPHSSLLPTDFTETQEQFIWDAMAETIALAQFDQDQDEHAHGGDPSCPDCHQVAEASMRTALNQGSADAVAYFNEIPGVADMREAYELAKTIAEGKAAEGQDLITIVN